MHMQLAANLSLLFEPATAWPERCERAAAAGFRHAEILFPYDRAATYYDAALRQAGLQAILINTPVDGHFGLAAVDGAENQFKHDLQRAMATAQALGATGIHVMAGQASPQHCLSESVLLANLEWALRQVEGTGLVLMLEALNRHDIPHYLYHDPHEVHRIVQSFAHPQLRQQFDIYHSLREQLPLLATLQACRTAIGHVQIAHGPLRSEPKLQEDGIAQALHALVATGYDGFLGCEYRPAHSFEAGLAWLNPLQQDGTVTPLAPHPSLSGEH
ncbi:TIM barrel protein [Lampropedia aestuarii]|uniref:TIM barrel protein n=1 Tax=Lampropedia aestuarii TaxID=2562762 RepID=UPI002469B94E|nr:TIM barrel protein [Lampropedia aestuarii]MDH5858800.1 TIM barrel protein [Lampropedia aestuarii]